MSRFFKSAAFPILIVVVLAFFAQKLISPGRRDAKPQLRRLPARSSTGGQVKTRRRSRPRTTRVEVTLEDGKPSTRSAIPDDYAPS